MKEGRGIQRARRAREQGWRVVMMKNCDCLQESLQLQWEDMLTQLDTLRQGDAAVWTRGSCGIVMS